MSARTIRLSLPSKGRLSEASMEFLADCGLAVHKPNPRQYEARIPNLPGLRVIFQRPADIVVSVRDGSVDFGITGIDLIEEKKGPNGELLVLHDELGFGHCALTLAVPEAWEDVESMPALADYAAKRGAPLRVATKYPRLTDRFLEEHAVPHQLIHAEGTLETAPTIGYADLISDLVSSGQTLKDNRLRPLEDGVIQTSQAALIANRAALENGAEALRTARVLLEFIEAHLRAAGNLAIFANVRGESAEAVARSIFAQETIGGLQGPTISHVYTRQGAATWFDVHIIVRRERLFDAINDLRAIGGSGVVVSPVTYIFEEEPPRYKAMIAALEA